MGDKVKRIKPVGVGLLTALALMLAVLPASGASAAKKVLQLSVGGTPVANGSPGDTGLLLDECIVFSSGTVVTNGAPKDKLTAASNAASECPEGRSVSGTITETQLASSGKVTLKGTITITEPGPCVYAFSKFKSTFAVPGMLNFEGTTTGKLNKALSIPECGKKSTQFYVGDATPEVFGEPFEVS
jgi:hypothetical protein